MAIPNRIHEFARRTGVTVKALHHYDRLGLLSPKRTDAGYRMYSRADRERLAQIVALKSLGLPLKRIKALLDQQASLPDALAHQRRVLEEKRRRLDRAIRAISDIEHAGREAESSSSAFPLRKLVEVIEMHKDLDPMRSDFDRAADPARAPDRVCQSRLTLFREIEAVMAEAPSGDRARDLVARWYAMRDEETGGDETSRAALRRFFASRRKWPAAFQTYVASLYMTSWETWVRVADFLEQARTTEQRAR